MKHELRLSDATPVYIYNVLAALKAWWTMSSGRD